MTRTQAQIIELFQTLPAVERRELAEQLYEHAVRGTFHDRMTPEQRAELDQSIAEADRGEGAPANEVFERFAQKFGFTRSP
jgi:hypothetical protein